MKNVYLNRKAIIKLLGNMPYNFTQDGKFVGDNSVIYLQGEELYKFDKKSLRNIRDCQELESKERLELSAQLLTKMDDYRDKVKTVDFPEGIIYCEHEPIGCVLKYYPNCKNLGDIFDKLTYHQKLEICKQLAETVKELNEIKLYTADLNWHNILVDNNNKIHIIDLDDPRQTKFNNSLNKGWMYYMLLELIIMSRPKSNLLKFINYVWYAGEQDKDTITNEKIEKEIGKLEKIINKRKLV